MILDGQMKLSDSQAINADAASTNVIDNGVAANIGDGEPMGVLVVVKTSADMTTGDETYTFKLQCDDAENFPTPKELLSVAIPGAQLTAGKTHVLPLPIGVEIERFLRMFYDLGGTTPSITVSAFVMPLSMIDKYRTYKDNSPIS